MADTATEIALATTTLASPTTTITFSSIPSTYTDLRVVVSALGTAGLYCQLNSDTAGNYSYTLMYSSGSAVATTSATSTSRVQLTVGINLSSSIPTFYGIDYFSYAGSTYKTLSYGSNQDLNGTGYVVNGVGMWRSTSAITSISIYSTSNLSTGTTATLYGIL